MNSSMVDGSSSPGMLGALTTEQQDQLSRILDEYLSALERGEPLERESLLHKHPQLREPLQLYLAKLDDLHEISAGFTAPHESTDHEELSDQGPQRDQEPQHDHEPQRLGDFRLIRQIGRGGMGIVYEAEQVSLHRKVAIKLLPFAAVLDTNQIARFQHEASAAAQLHHPHIVPIYAVGQQRGVHYYAMQLIVGHSLDEGIEWLRNPQATLDDRRFSAVYPEHASRSFIDFVITVGIQAAEALHAAHEAGIIHRDVKPSNLMIDTQQKLWVTDFGLARCQHEKNLTRTGDLVGTMRYMSPEQARGQSMLVDHRSDLYSLGATLYELLALRPAVPGEDAIDLLKHIEHHEPERLRLHCPTAPLDLETVIAKAMAKNREDRYWTAADFAADLRRVLQGEPTVARPPSYLQLASRWIASHRRGAAVTVFVLLLAMIGLLISNLMISRQKQIAEENIIKQEKYFQQAHEAVEQFGLRMAEQLADVPGAEPLRKDILQEALEYYQEFAVQAQHDPRLVSDLALTYSKIGTLSDKLGSADEAIRSLQSAQLLFERLRKQAPDSLEHQRHAAVNLNNLALIWTRQGAMDAANEAYAKAISMQEDLVSRGPTSIPLRIELAMSYNNQGLMLAKKEELAAATKAYETALKVLQQVGKEEPHDRLIARRIANVTNNLSGIKAKQDPGLAIELYEQAIDAQLRSISSEERAIGPTRDLALTYNNLGAAEAKQKLWQHAESHVQTAIELQAQLIKLAPGVMTYRRDLAVSLNQLGLIQHSQGQTAEAVQSFHRAIETQGPLLEREPQNQPLCSSQGSLYNNWGMSLEASGDLKGAVDAYRRGTQLQRIALENQMDNREFRENFATHVTNLSRVFRKQNAPADAIAINRERLALFPTDPEQLKSVAEELLLAGLVYKTMGNASAAADTVQEAKEVLQRAEENGLVGAQEILQQSPYQNLR